MINIGGSLVDILCDLIRIKSETGEEGVICDELFCILEGLDGELVREKNNIVYSINNDRSHKIALVGHIDTVPVDRSMIEPKIKGEELWGRGACDMKAGVACMLKMINDINRGVINLNYNIDFIFYEGEEGPVPNGINTLIDNNYIKNIDFAFVLEPTESKYSVGCLGSLTVCKKLNGVSAHSANPIKGENVLDQVCRLYENVKKENMKISIPKEIDGLKYYETINVTSVKTFNANNVIPAYSEVIINYRFSPSKEINKAKEFIYKCVGKENTEIIDASISCYIGSEESSYLDENIEKEIMQAWTDIAQLNEVGISSINFGPGTIMLAHKPDERININELNKFYEILKDHV